jgi:DNA-binding CsgD family transcriptional regulator
MRATAIASALERGRESFRAEKWGEAYAELTVANHGTPLEPEDVDRLATAAHLLGKTAESLDLWARAHHDFASHGDARRAARCAFRIAQAMMFKGQVAGANGWIARAQRLLDEGGHDCAERGYLLLPTALRHALDGDGEPAYSAFGQAAAIGERFGEPDLIAFGRLGQGRSLIRMGETTRGVGLLDEVMVSVTSGEVSPLVVGDVYCSVIEGCDEIFDLRRAQEWTAELTRWCESHPDRGPYRGQCLIHRAEIMQLHGAWTEAMDEAVRARDWLLQPPAHAAAGAASYRIGEMHRLRGEFAAAEEAYRQASEWGREPQPGLARLRLAQGQTEAARSAISRAAGETRSRRLRPPLLAAQTEIMLATGDVSGARRAADELAGIAKDVGAPLLLAMSAQAAGAVLLAEKETTEALASLREALARWRELDAPYDAAGTRVLIGLACRRLGDTDAAGLELDAAVRTYERLGALPDATRTRDLLAPPVREARSDLTSRELQVLALVATGKTNRGIAEELAISEKTVARHVSNILAKLGVPSRAAATAYAFRNTLVPPRT